MPLFHDWKYQIFPFCHEETLFISLQNFSTDVYDEEILCDSEMFEYLHNSSLLYIYLKADLNYIFVLLSD